MIIIHNMKIKTWERVKNNHSFGKENIEEHGFLHCCKPEQFHLIIPRLKKNGGDFAVIFIDTDKLASTLKWEYSKSMEQDFPHIYGEINRESVVKAVSLEDYENEYGSR